MCRVRAETGSLMSNVLDKLLLAERESNQIATRGEKGQLKQQLDALENAALDVGKASSGSWIGYFSTIYRAGLEPKGPGVMWDEEWGQQGTYSNRNSKGWATYLYESIEAEILKRAGVAKLDEIEAASEAAETELKRLKVRIVASMEAYVAHTADQTITRIKSEIADQPVSISAQDLIKANSPKQIMSRDSQAIQGGIQAPLHLRFFFHARALSAPFLLARELAEKLTFARAYLEERSTLKGQSMAKRDGKIFLGHGRSPQWKTLKDFLVDRLKLEYDEFNRESPAGKTTKERLEQMLNESSFAFLVMTGEDESADGKALARQNVVHEVGLFQGRLGFGRAIVLLEEGCEEFSNIHGLGQIRFPKGKLEAVREEVRQVLEREGII